MQEGSQRTSAVAAFKILGQCGRGKLQNGLQSASRGAPTRLHLSPAGTSGSGIGRKWAGGGGYARRRWR